MLDGGSRHRARERALELLYEAFIKGRPVGVIIASLPVAPDPYASTLARAAEEQRDDSDERISRHLREWSFDRLALVDRLIMELALGELSLAAPPPRAVVLDEAVELAHEFSTDGSPRFVNGVLSACLEETPSPE